MMKAKISVLAILMPCTALLILEACHTRKVALNKTDSSFKQTEAGQFHSEVQQTDKTKISQVISTNSKDTSATIITFIPADGNTITVQPNGTIQGVFKSITSKSNRTGQSTTSQTINQVNDVNQSAKVDSAVKKQTATVVQKKEKVTESKPSYGWIIYVAIGLIIIAGAIYAYFRFLK